MVRSFEEEACDILMLMEGVSDKLHINARIQGQHLSNTQLPKVCRSGASKAAMRHRFSHGA